MVGWKVLRSLVKSLRMVCKKSLSEKLITCPVEVFVKTEEEDEKGDSLEQHTHLTPVETPCVEPLNPER
jgi:hypothetical protein